MDCDCKDNFYPFTLRVHRAFTSDAWDFYADTPWMPATASVRAVLRLLAEQSDGVDLSAACQTASYRFDKAAALDDWALLGTVRTTEGDSDPEDLSPTVANKFWIRFGRGIRKGAGAGAIGVASAGIQWSLPTERPRLLVGPQVVNAYDNPVSDVYTELLSTPWMPYYQLQELVVAYESFDADADFRYTVVLQSVKSDPTQQAPAEDTVLSSRTGNVSGTASQTTFTLATQHKAQLCRVVLKADSNGQATAKRGRVYLAVASRYA